MKDPEGTPLKHIQTEKEYIHVPSSSIERFLTPPAESRKHMSNRGFHMAGISTWSEGYHVDRHSFIRHLLLFTLEGEGQLSLGDGSKQVLSRGDLFIAPKGSSFRYSTEDSWRAMWLHVSPREEWNLLMGKDARVRKWNWGMEIVRVMRGFIDESNRRCVDSSIAIRSYVDLLALYVKRELTTENTIVGVDSRHSLEDLWESVQENLHEGWSVESLAKLANMSRSSFHRCVLTLTGKSPMQVVHAMRMERAMELLLYSDSNLATIAEKVGYESQFSFSKAFKKYTQTSPTEFRESKSNEGE